MEQQTGTRQRTRAFTASGLLQLAAGEALYPILHAGLGWEYGDQHAYRQLFVT